MFVVFAGRMALPLWLNKVPPQIRIQILITGAFLLVGVALGSLSVYYRFFIFTDGAVYATLGKNLAERIGLRYCGAPHLFYPPGYPFAIAVLYWIVQDAELAGHLVSLLAYLTSILLISRLAWKLHPSILFMALATAVVTFHPQFRTYAGDVMSESLFTCVIIASALLCWELANRDHPPIWLWIVWGLLGGFAYLIRADGILYWPLQAGFILVYGKGAISRHLLFCALSGFVLLLAIGPYLLLIHTQTGKWQLSTKTAILLEFAEMRMEESGMENETRRTSALSKDGQSFEIDQADETLTEFIMGRPREAARRVTHNALYLFRRPGISFGWINLPVLLFLCWLLGHRVGSSKAVFLYLHLLPIGLFLLFYIDTRFLLAFIPFFGLAYARAAEPVLFWIERYSRGNRRWFLTAGILAVVGMGVFFQENRVVSFVQRLLPVVQDLPLEHKEMGYWMRNHLTIQPTTRISHRNPWVSFYAGACHVRTAYTSDLNQLLDWLRLNQAQYLIVDERMTAHYYPGLAFLLDEEEEHRGLRFIHAIEGDKPKIVLYEIIPEDQESSPSEG